MFPYASYFKTDNIKIYSPLEIWRQVFVSYEEDQKAYDSRMYMEKTALLITRNEKKRNETFSWLTSVI